MLTIPQFITVIHVFATSISYSFVDDLVFGNTNMHVSQIFSIYQATQILLYNYATPSIFVINISLVSEQELCEQLLH